jgi:hypothetical protein
VRDIHVAHTIAHAAEKLSISTNGRGVPGNTQYWEPVLLNIARTLSNIAHGSHASSQEVNNHNQTLSATMHTRLKSHWSQFQPEVNANDVILILFCIVLLFTISEQAGKVSDFHHKSRKRRLISPP